MPLLDTTRDFSGDVFRNIVSLRESVDFFDDLSGGTARSSAYAVNAEARVKSDASPDFIRRGFHYTTAIAYPFETEPYLSTRFGDGSFGVWYGSLKMETTIRETAFHMVREELRNETPRAVYRERAVYRTGCLALLIDLTGKVEEFPGLVAEDHDFTQSVARRLQREGHPGLLAPSARHRGGINLAAFSPGILSNPRLSCYLGYRFDPASRSVEVERTPGKLYLRVRF